MSRIDPIFFGTVKEGKLSVRGKSDFEQHLKRFEGKEVEVIVRRYRPQRTISQNNYYWGVIVKMISEDTGHDTETVHNWLKTKFNKKRILVKGIPQEVVDTTTRLDVWGFSEDYWEPIQRWAAEFLGLVIPDPDRVESKNIL